MDLELILASNNAGKLREMRQLFADLDVKILSQREAGCDFEVEETGGSFEENAFLKASAVTRATGLPAVADDSGLMVDALDGAPGIYSARFSGSHDDSDETRCRYLLQKLEGVSDRRAKFVCCVCCTFPNGDILRARGECPGEILTQPRGDGGFGYDPIFQPDGFNYSMAELGTVVKNQLGHRGRAVRKFREELEKYYADK